MVNFFQSAMLQSGGVEHRFFGRKGGVSSGIFHSLNLHPGSGDDAGNVYKNQQIITNLLGLNENNLKILKQIHSDRVMVIGQDNVAQRMQDIEGDAMVTCLPGVALGVVTADCCPVLFIDPIHKVIGAAHAGWRGVLKGVIESTVSTMEQSGAKRENIRAAIGPAITWNSYEVDGQFKQKFLEEAKGNQDFFKPSLNDNRYMFNLKGYVYHKLVTSNIAECEDIDLDTYTLEEEFFSCRRAQHRGETRFGDQISLIYLKKDGK